MSLEFKSQNLNIKAIGSKVTVPDNNLAKLMYYLHCVFSVIQLEGNDQYTQYQNYNLVTKEEEIEIIGLVKLYEPKIMIKLSLFIVDPYLVPSDVSNEFFELTDERINFHIDKNIMIGGKSLKVQKIMVCKESWINNNYYQPLKEYYTFQSRLSIVLNIESHININDDYHLIVDNNNNNKNNEHSKPKCICWNFIEKICSYICRIFLVLILIMYLLMKCDFFKTVLKI